MHILLTEKLESSQLVHYRQWEIYMNELNIVILVKQMMVKNIRLIG